MPRSRDKNRPSRRKGQFVTTHIGAFEGKTPESRANQLKNLRQYSGKPKAPQPVLPDLKTCDIITFATEYLKVSFEERPAQEVILRSLYGLPLDVDQVEIYRKLTTNDTVFEHNGEKAEADLAIGARGGKSFLVSIIALYESIAKADYWRSFLRPNETGYAVITATRQKQCEDIIQASCTNLLENSSLKYLIDGEPVKAELRLTNGLAIVSLPCNSTAGRGLPIFLLIFDEICHYRTEGPKADETIHNALRPRQAQFPGAKCLKISTVAGKQGLFWDEFSEGFCVPGRLTIQAPTRLVNPVIPQDFIDKEYRRDSDNAAREFGSIFAETVEGFFESCMDRLKACFVLPEDVPYVKGNQYHAAIDQSGLSGRDAWAFSVAHQDHTENKIIQDVARSWYTNDIIEILGDIVTLCSEYKIGTMSADRYAGGIVAALFKSKGLEVVFRELLPVIYKNFKTLVTSDKIMLQDNGRLRRGLVTTQAFWGKNQRLSITHERTKEGHADIADATVTVVYDVSKGFTVVDYSSHDSGGTTTREQDDAMCEYDVLNLL